MPCVSACTALPCKVITLPLSEFELGTYCALSWLVASHRWACISLLGAKDLFKTLFIVNLPTGNWALGSERVKQYHCSLKYYVMSFPGIYYLLGKGKH